ncbi:MAG: long-chain fatty acid--CoA ligase [Chloroflexota bacterium]|jgi:long-chain acyl-CoA synthetase
MKPWLNFYEAHVPPNLTYPELTLPAALNQTARNYPGYPFIIFKGRSFTFQQINEAVDLFARALQKLGVGIGDRVAIHLPNCPQFVIVYYAILRLGALAVPCNPIYTAREMTHQLNDSGASAIVTLSAMYPLIKEIRSQTQLEQVIVAKIKTYLPSLLRLLFTLFLERRRGHWMDISGEANTFWFTGLLEETLQGYQPADITLQDPAVLMYTGGTTGLSKAALLTHQNIMANAFQVRVWVNAVDKPVRVLASLPLFHSYGMTTCMNSCVLYPSTVILVPDPRDTDDVLKTIDKQRPQLYPGVPAIYVAINNHPQVKKYDLSSIQTCISGAAPLPPEVQGRFQELTGARLVEGYGLSEASPITHGNPAFGESRIGTIGLPFPDTEVKIVDPDAGTRILDIGQPGEMCVRGPQVMKAYWQRPSETANALRADPAGGEPWLYTGDIASMDEDGYFRIVDRKKDLILGAGGFNIYPREIEDVLYEHPKVLEAAVVGVPVEGKGERAKAFLVLKPGQSATEEEILDFCRQNLAPHKVPRFVEFRDQLPKSQVGKVIRRKLIEEE